MSSIQKIERIFLTDPEDRREHQKKAIVFFLKENVPFFKEIQEELLLQIGDEMTTKNLQANEVCKQS